MTSASTQLRCSNSLTACRSPHVLGPFLGLFWAADSSPCLCHAADGACLIPVGHVIYHGPVNHVMDFFEGQGFRIPERKGIPDFLQEVTSYKDQAVSLVRVAFPSCCLWLPVCHQDAACS